MIGVVICEPLENPFFRVPVHPFENSLVVKFAGCGLELDSRAVRSHFLRDLNPIIEDDALIKKILIHLGLWETRNHDPP